MAGGAECTQQDPFHAVSTRVLVEIVKLIQKRGMRGEKGGWKEFLKVCDKKLGDSLSDPARRSPDVLLAFIKSFKEESDVQLFAKVIKCHTNREATREILKSEHNESPEERLVRLTFEHPLYPIDYTFPSHEEDWVVTKLSKKNKDGRSSKLLAVDCEMVICEDGSEALAKICLVDRGLKVKLHQFVNPGKVVVDYKTSITGVSAEDFSGSVTSLADTQRTVRRLLNGCILVGHGLSNDLRALKIDHARVIDTSYIFKYGDESAKRRPSLNDLCKAVLGYEVRKKDAPHNCQDDACAAMKLVLAKLEKGFDNVIPVLEEKLDTVQVDSGVYKLLVHRIPITMPCEEINQIIHGEYVTEVLNSKRKVDRYSVHLNFKTPEEAHQTFQDIIGDETNDTGGLPQKSISVKLKSGVMDTIYIRKMTRDSKDVSTKKRPCPEEQVPIENKVLKTDEAVDVGTRTASVDQAVDVGTRTACVDHVEEIKWLKGLLSKRDEEISALHKIIAAVTRKQGL